jgi:glycosyltransferase involved in cell wall biosynthesis
MSTPAFSIIIPVYNRPHEVDELLQSLTLQSQKDFEIIVVEDGSSLPCQHIVDKYSNQLSITYLNKSNSGPGPTRNYGAQRAKGYWLVFFDSDCIIPPHYFQHVLQWLKQNPCDAYGGPDRAHASFTPIQKAISYTMTSFFTTGGIRGGAKQLDKFYPRSFNMGIRRLAFEKVNGFAAIRFGEDVDLSLRLVKGKFKTQLIPPAYVYHKRRTDFRKFYRQVYSSGLARITLHLLHPGSLKMVHALPAAFVVSMVLALIGAFILPILLLIPVAYSALILVHSLINSKSPLVATLSVPAAWVQLCGYGVGFMVSFWKRVILKQGKHSGFEKNLYA